ncbi:alkaline phosphatase family protein [Nocardioides bizhenqiangii]|uniref:Alkaline phosphatase family protein n=1 Tax=Nocardioides bizhenqiangii TaxID=3095076 RepID=A0ABZ0ZPA8_9ACTN|nr:MULTISPECIES: alkaline phosphatase family protein [unclassified Nocardioides]MDZ5619935.1 alkaline phosphatase family protein [Nocardioides sp. HM23]WQQ26062.1 alkaline phosphatase family protein [Nocardioides sp. HM61]
MPHPPTPASSRASAATFALVALVGAIAVGGLWWVQQDDASPSDASESSSADPSDSTTDVAGSTANDGGRGDGSDADPGLGDDAEEIAAQGFPDDPRVVVISVDSLGSLYVSRTTTPTIADLLAQGAGTLNARTEVEKTVTLPNHTGMVTGDRVNRFLGGHGVTWNDTSRRSVARRTESVFSTIDEAGGTSAVFVGKEKFEMWERAWPGTIDDLVFNQDQPALVDAAIADLREDDHDLVFVHLAGPDNAGHKSGWGSDPYLDAVTLADADIDRIVSAIVADPELSEEVVVIVTADHGGVPEMTSHSDRRRPENYTIPFVVWGPGITPGDLYALNPDYQDPGNGRPRYVGPQPVRNGNVANLVTDLLGLDPVPRSLFGDEHDLDVD